MKKLYFIAVFYFLFSQFTFSQESYSVLKLSIANAPVIDGDIDEIWGLADRATIAKDVDDGSRTTEKSPNESDYKAEFGAFWSDSGLYVLVEINDDVYVNDNGNEWWKDDDVNFLFSPALTTASGTPIEFAWLVKSNVEGKATLVQDVGLDEVSAAWSNLGTAYILEVYIKWSVFSVNGTEGADVLFEARVRDDDKDGEFIYPQSFLQWSTDQKSVETDGAGMGTLSLSSEEAVISSLLKNTENLRVNVFPNPAANKVQVEFVSNVPGHIKGSIIDISGKEVISFSYYVGGHTIKTIDVSSLNSGTYFITTESPSQVVQHKLSIIK